MVAQIYPELSSSMTGLYSKGFHWDIPFYTLISSINDSTITATSL